MRIAAMPAAPARMHSAAFDWFTPPIAITGILTAFAHRGEFGHTMRRAERNFRRRLVDRPEVGVAGAGTFRFSRAFQAVARNSDEKIRRSVSRRHQRTTSRAGNEAWPRCTPAAPAARATSRRSLMMTGAARGPARHCLPCELEKFARREIFLANLHPVDACGHSRANCFEQRGDGFVPGERLAIRHVAKIGGVIG